MYVYHNTNVAFAATFKSQEVSYWKNQLKPKPAKKKKKKERKKKKEKGIQSFFGKRTHV